jgi:hypothetical protein
MINKKNIISLYIMPEETKDLLATIGSDGILGEIDPFDFLTLLASTGRPDEESLRVFAGLWYKTGV